MDSSKIGEKICYHLITGMSFIIFILVLLDLDPWVRSKTYHHLYHEVFEGDRQNIYEVALALLQFFCFLFVVIAVSPNSPQMEYQIILAIHEQVAEVEVDNNTAG